LTVFLSGTMEDLREERTAIRSQIGVPLYRVVAAEDWGARCRAPRELCVDAARTSDVYLGLYGGRYGYIPPDETLSVTEWEFNTAREAGKPALLYVRRGRKGPKQRPFLARVTDFRFGHNRRPEFENCDQLAAWVEEDLVTLMEDLIRETGNDTSVTRDPLTYVKCRLNLGVLAGEAQQREQAIYHYQWILDNGIWNVEAHQVSLRELQSLYVAEERWSEAIDALWRSVDLLPLLPLADVPAEELRGLEESRFRELARLYALWATSDSDQCNWEQAVDSYREAEQVYRRMVDWQGVREIQSALAVTYEKWAEARAGVRRWADAIDHLRDALVLYEALENAAKIALVWYRLGQLRKEQRRSREALNCFERSLEYRKDSDGRFVIPFGVVLSAHDEIIRRRLAREGEFYYAVLQLCKKADDLFIAGEAQEAVTSARRALTLSRRRQARRPILISRCYLGRLLLKTGRPEQAISEYETALELAESLGDEVVRNELLDQLERIKQEYREALGRAEEQNDNKTRNEIQGHLDRLQMLLLRGYA